MIAVFIAPVYIAVCLYILLRFFRCLGYCDSALKSLLFRVPFSIIYAVFAFSPLIAFFLPKATLIRRLIQQVANCWFGTMAYALMIIALCQLVSVLLRRVFHILPKDFFRTKSRNIISLALSFAIIASVSTYGFYHARDIKVNKDYSVVVNKSVDGMESLNVVLIADLHIGYSIGVNHITNMVNLINEQKPDIVCIAGDIYDNDFDAFDDPDALAEALSKIQSKYGTFACWGNHDVNQKILGGFTFDNEPVIEHDYRISDFLKKANINILEDESVLIDDKFYVVGRVDGEKPATENDIRKNPDELLEGLDKSKPIFVIYHEPDELSELAEAGTDLLLCGHTHDGQLFPGNILTGLMWENSCGYLQKGNMHNIVTSGVGIWGPFMRVGTDSEICPIQVNFSQVE